MPFFNFRRGGSGSASNAAAAQPASAEMLRKRARHRLIGAAVLVLIGVVGFPLLFDTQPRPIAVDIPIVIPGKATAPPLTAPVAAAPAVAPAAVAPTKPEPPEKVAAAASLAPQEEIVSSRPAPAPVESRPAPKPEAKPEPKVDAKPEHKPEPKPEVKPEVKPAPKPAVASDDGARARALLNGTVAPVVRETAAHADAGDARLVVQVGAFADAAKAHEARLKLERAGLKTYTQVADTKDGKRTRVRVGPFATKADAEKAAGKIRALDLPASILTL